MASSKNYPFLLEIRSPQERGLRASHTRGLWTRWLAAVPLILVGIIGAVAGREAARYALEQCAQRACDAIEQFAWIVATFGGGLVVALAGAGVIFCLVRLHGHRP